ncbi:NADP(H)-dependent aldo-keto reductase [Pseudomonas guariconensis]|uniref:NADP(H)-dependent aldo-keto reductase n=1 Tax=Pseudomonas TaxID=286 RepID=UPI00209842C1|nr:MULTISPECIES: NADP(H)-dependent aldo-keto reductase [Pseudomonas]MCO7640232.1 NADP(H)-dependent aldo-keto reductase [Pseudomonas sp. S 311-6]MCO7515962.1 NADP(H)-dependent aldo-keto reductase [Pseudomonas putida]MCO7565576.1 NADP(H)-dependent aldo-keto reductase [Pseudomonas mosselii]MCO7606439.1 NADP(H)-dependent aldo-keto reductase [Pseudomonas guariconensis]MCO7617684.1 NADP(H)-dependent aldo-keto reductase [Pseudomonas guariconensis]
MLYRRLGHTELSVSLLSLGTMTWGHQNTEQDAHQQLDAATAAGINFIDTAEMYPTPTRAETWTTTERYLGNWLAARGNRDKLVLASKIAGPARDPAGQGHIRDGLSHHDRKNIVAALEGSLRRLRTDYLDLYQLHWPDRASNFFGIREYPYVKDHPSAVAIEETLAVLDEQVKAGKVRHIGVSNETPWGVARFLRHSEDHGLARIASIQNPYSLLNRLYEHGLSEFSHREGVSLLAYSPLAFGALTGKYLEGARPEGARLSSVYRTFNRYDSTEANSAIAGYVDIARRHGLSPAQLALAFVIRQPFVASAITGQTTLLQLQENLGALDVRLSDEVLAEIQAVHRRIPNPSP